MGQIVQAEITTKILKGVSGKRTVLILTIDCGENHVKFLADVHLFSL